MNPRAAVPLVAAATFVAGFGVAELTGVRAVGGLVLVAGGIWCGRLAVPIVGRRVTVALLAIALALFVLSHPLGKAIGALAGRGGHRCARRRCRGGDRRVEPGGGHGIEHVITGV